MERNTDKTGAGRETHRTPRDSARFEVQRYREVPRASRFTLSRLRFDIGVAPNDLNRHRIKVVHDPSLQCSIECSEQQILRLGPEFGGKKLLFGGGRKQRKLRA